MRVFRFDPAVSVPISQFDSRFKIGPLTGLDMRGRVQVMHLPPGGNIGRHPTAIQQMFAVVAGSAVVSGDDAKPRTLDAGYAAVWDVGEEHDARSDDGCTAICVEGTFDVWAVAVTQEISVEDYDDDWPRRFDQICAHVWPAVREHAIRIDHVGSTSVPGLAAKPIIDMDIVVADESKVRPVILALRDIGYRWRGDLDVAGREAFAQPEGLPRHHLYLVVENNKAHLDHWLLRDLLREDAEARERYAALKRKNALEVEGDMDEYIVRKHDLVTELLERARRERGLS